MSTSPGKNLEAVKFGEKLKILRVSQPGSPSLAEFGVKLKVSKASLSRYEAGETEPPVSFLGRLIEVVGPSAMELVPALELQPGAVTGALPEHVERAYLTLLEILDQHKAVPADADRKVFARLLGKAAREYARAGGNGEEVRRELVRDAEMFLGLLK